MDKRLVTTNTTRVALIGAGLLLLGWAGMIGWWRYGPEMLLGLASSSLSLCF
ncbi:MULTISPECIES: hypothetical protein [unclassified Rhizobium]|uniref:hypothetical protein n=1 Tax=unclassified Rhizobium TaxID=2613769 RepID=UPI000ABF0E19|nr:MULTISPECIES: hypothetical protein [unclassified Rhizobium]